MSVTISQLSNGLTIATDTMPDAQSAALGLWVAVGTRDEPPEAQGVAHLIEHMLFKGTARRTALELSEAIEGVGGYMNAYTSREETAYYVRVLPEHVELATDVVADMLQHSILDPAELERERGVIIQEIGQAYDTPEDYIFDCAQEAAFPQQGLGWPILGQAKNIATMPREALQNYLTRFYGAQNMIFAASGKVTHQAMVTLAENYFGKLAAGTAITRQPAQYKGGTRHEARDLEQHHCVISFPSPAFRAEDYTAGQMLAVILGGGSASRLFQEVREKRGLAYHVSAGTQAYDDAGLLSLYAGTAPEQAAELQQVIWQELGRLPHDMNSTEFDRARAQLRAGLLMAQDAPQARLEQLAGNWLIYGRDVPLAEKLARLDAVTKDMVAELAALLTPTNATVVTLGTKI
jgi:predicted Zn-dependent peptidase